MVGAKRPFFYINGITGEVVRNMPDEKLLVCAPSYITFMERWCSALEANNHNVHPSQGISRFINTGPYTSRCVTRGICIEATSILCVEVSNNERHPGASYAFPYRIRITFVEPESTLRAVLTTRHWRIQNGNEPEQRVDGPGVIGLYPVYIHCSHACSHKSLPQYVCCGFWVFNTQIGDACWCGTIRVLFNDVYHTA